MKISASVYSNKEKDMLQLVKELDQFSIDFLHIDCNDDLTVFDDIRKIRQVSKTPIDLHIISSEPEKFYPEIIANHIELVTFQFENLKSKLTPPPEVDSKIGIAITTDTDIAIFDDYIDVASFILFMTTIPGQSGGVFAEENFDKIRQFKNKYPNKKIHVDGGVNDEVSFILRNIGVYSAVSGSYLVTSEEIGDSLLKLKTDLRGAHYHIKDFMHKRNELPILQYEGVTFKEILELINEYKFGFCLVEDRERNFKGVVTDGDVRRALLKEIDNVSGINIDSMINVSPKTVDFDMDLKKMMEILKDSANPITFLPVLENGTKIKGAVSFNNLIKGEL